MDFISIIMIGVGLAMDAFSVSVTDGILLKKPKCYQAGKIALFFGAFQFIMPCIGYLLGSTFSRYIEAFDHWIAFTLLVFIGCKMIYEAINEKSTEDIKNPLSISTLTVLAIATSIDALAAGVTFATINVPVIFSSAVIGIVTFYISLAGVYIGSNCGNLFGNKSEIAGGAVLIIIGVKILTESLLGM